MKKVIRILGLCAVVAIAFNSCKKNDEKSFKATTVQFQSESESKTHIAGNFPFSVYLTWDLGNVINVFDANGGHADFEVESIGSDKKTAEFYVSEDKYEFMSHLDTDDGFYTAFYPNAVLDNNEVLLSVPTEQTQAFATDFGGANVADNTFPMIGHNQGGVFGFVTDASILRLEFFKTNVETNIDRIVLSSRTENELIAGNLRYNLLNGQCQFEGLNPTITINSTYNPSEWNSTLASMSYTVILPAGIFADGFNVDVYSGETCVGHFLGHVNDASGTQHATEARKYYYLGAVTLQ